MVKITSYGVRPIEQPYFERLNTYDFDMHYVEALLTHDNVEESKGSDAVLVRGNCVVDRQNLQKFADWGIKYVFTRSVGFNHMDLQAGADLGIEMARVPGYSPYAVAELAMTMGLNLFRHVNMAVNQTRQANFTITNAMFSKEIHTATVGIVGAGRIGLTEAKLYKALGAKVLAYDPYPSDEAKEVTELRDLPSLLADSDIVSIHVPYFPGKNENLVNEDFVSQMKQGAVLINTARGELADVSAIIAGLDAGKLSGYGADVVLDEVEIIGHAFDAVTDVPNETVRQLIQHDNVLVTPHVGSYTESALQDMISISYKNFHDILTTGKTKNAIHI